MRLSEGLTKIQSLRDEKQILKEKMEIRNRLFEEENKEIISRLIEIRNELDTAENEVRLFAVNSYLESGEKSLDFGVKIRVMTQLKYDYEAALGWAKSHNLALSLDKKAFENIAKTSKIEFVEYLEVPTATIPSTIEVE